MGSPSARIPLETTLLAFFFCSTTCVLLNSISKDFSASFTFDTFTHRDFGYSFVCIIHTRIFPLHGSRSSAASLNNAYGVIRRGDIRDVEQAHAPPLFHHIKSLHAAQHRRDLVHIYASIHKVLASAKLLSTGNLFCLFINIFAPSTIRIGLFVFRRICIGEKDPERNATNRHSQLVLTCLHEPLQSVDQSNRELKRT